MFTRRGRTGASPGEHHLTMKKRLDKPSAGMVWSLATQKEVEEMHYESGSEISPKEFEYLLKDDLVADVDDDVAKACGSTVRTAAHIRLFHSTPSMLSRCGIRTAEEALSALGSLRSVVVEYARLMGPHFSKDLRGVSLCFLAHVRAAMTGDLETVRLVVCPNDPRRDPEHDGMAAEAAVDPPQPVYVDAEQVIERYNEAVAACLGREGGITKDAQ